MRCWYSCLTCYQLIFQTVDIFFLFASKCSWVWFNSTKYSFLIATKYFLQCNGCLFCLFYSWICPFLCSLLMRQEYKHNEDWAENEKKTAFVRLWVHTPHGPQANTASIVKRKHKKSNRKAWGAVDQTRLKQLNVKTMSRRSCRGGRWCLLWLIRVNWLVTRWPFLISPYPWIWIKKKEIVGRIAAKLGFGSNCCSCKTVHRMCVEQLYASSLHHIGATQGTMSKAL